MISAILWCTQIHCALNNILWHFLCSVRRKKCSWMFGKPSHFCWALSSIQARGKTWNVLPELWLLLPGLWSLLWGAIIWLQVNARIWSETCTLMHNTLWHRQKTQLILLKLHCLSRSCSSPNVAGQHSCGQHQLKKKWVVAFPGTRAAFHFWGCGRSWRIWVGVCHWWCYQSSSLLCSILCRDKTNNTDVVIPWSLGWQRWRRQWYRIQWRRGRRNTARELQHAPWWWTMPCRRIHRL